MWSTPAAIGCAEVIQASPDSAQWLGSIAAEHHLSNLARVMIRYVIATGMYFGESYEEVLRLLEAGRRA